MKPIPPHRIARKTLFPSCLFILTGSLLPACMAVAQTPAPAPTSTQDASSQSSATQSSATQSSATQSSATQDSATQDSATQSSATQGSATQGAAAESSGLQRHPLNIEDTQPDPHEEYLLGGGDEIVVSVAGRPELSGSHVVGPDGRITLPLVGSIEVGEKSREAAARSIDEELGKYYSGKMSSTVQVTKYGSNHILLYGAIQHPGIISFDQPPTLLEAISRGGALVTNDKTTQSPKKCIIYRGDNQVLNVDISQRFSGARALNDIRLRRNDVVYVPENQESLISVLGEVKNQGPVPLTPKTTLTTLLADAGGITEKAGDPTIEIIEPSTGRIQRIKYKDLLKLQGGSDITLHDGDIVNVPRSGLAKTGFFFQQISPIAGMATIFTLAN